MLCRVLLRCGFPCSVGVLVVGFYATEKVGRLEYDELEQCVQVGPKTVETRNEFVSRCFIEFCGKRKGPVKTAYACLANEICGNVLPGLGEAAPFAIFNGFAGREHRGYILARHDGEVLRGGEFFYGLLAQYVCEVLTVGEGNLVFYSGVSSCFENGNICRLQ